MFPPLYFHLFVPFFLIHSINYMNKLQQRKIMRRCSVMIRSQKGVCAPAFTWVAQHRLQPGLRHTGTQVQGADKQATIGCPGRGLTAVTTGIHLCPHKHDEPAFFKYPIHLRILTTEQQLPSTWGGHTAGCCFSFPFAITLQHLAVWKCSFNYFFQVCGCRRTPRRMRWS